MRAGAPRAYMLFTPLELTIFTASVLLKNTALVALFFAVLLAGIALFYGREVKVEKGRIILEWGIIFKWRREITSTDVLEIIDAQSSRYLVLARYRPEVLLVPAGMVIAGILIFRGTEYGWVGLGWVLFGTVELVNYLSSTGERKLGASVILLVTGMLILIGYVTKPEAVVPLAISGFLMAAIFWEGGPLIGNTLFLVTERGIYSISYASKSELKLLISAMGDENEG